MLQINLVKYNSTESIVYRPDRPDGPEKPLNYLIEQEIRSVVGGSGSGGDGGSGDSGDGDGGVAVVWQSIRLGRAHPRPEPDRTTYLFLPSVLSHNLELSPSYPTPSVAATLHDGRGKPRSGMTPNCVRNDQR
ncbi:hypothetical protein HZH66_005314 [Vespula vulgaris]|uniref:Uncharacterized protein n=1 Tax=Vespula vulgaris TaxID=7454 RepID=A0A834KBU1_VESVU|nr:hypothetical protein HZH66_005314 [Vespula vulgaris]